MTKIIAMAGKGGTGKTTTSALLTRYLLKKRQTPFLLVDADANANLNELLGLDVNITLGQIRKELKGELPPNVTRDQFMEMKIHQALIEETGYDLLVMGQPDGPGCYCAANQYLAMTMDKLAENYKYIIVDNEAGMEHLSRMNMRTIDYLLVTSDPSARGILTAKRISDITEPLGLEIKNQFLLVNRAPHPVPPALQSKIDEAVADSGMQLGGIIPSSESLINQELSGESYLNLDDNDDIVVTVNEMFDKIFS
ncbi:CO dehydrogenase maturation factor [Desulfocapsa sulfexigens DSM 10523]|uniref:CO dehydrogenase maturation factor n=1 Tax=Desulfocapsa sulfexigens (strain DSM 10523 / SB164P1) TaxID=1167006 RepID=M1P8Y9_DESSD|nr:AAA family ATPase [Desulfocapsa sulfexigens]AGF79928.1 CO dehydrogenase maturation factor [Desulfocapsa sulfexigens DSM 10523]